MHTSLHTPLKEAVRGRACKGRGLEQERAGGSMPVTRLLASSSVDQESAGNGSM